MHEYHSDRRAGSSVSGSDPGVAAQPPMGLLPQRAAGYRPAGALDPRAGGASVMAAAITSANRVKGGSLMHRATKLSATGMVGLGRAGPPPWGDARDGKKAP